VKVDQDKKKTKKEQKKKRNSRHIPYPDWILNVTVTCKKSQFIAHSDKQCNAKLTDIDFASLYDLQETILICDNYQKNRKQKIL